MIDYPTYRKLHREEAAKTQKPKPATEIPPVNEEILDGPERFIFPSSIIGYNLRRKKWSKIHRNPEGPFLLTPGLVDIKVDGIRDIRWNKKAFDNLVVDEETKELIQALVTERLAQERGTDFIENKGNGLTILLHGGPGTGKTFTAESVAELAEKPLFRVTCGDIGTLPEEVEQYLESALHLGKIWDCVVLLDEADVFLEERTLNDLQRNALVTVFLRLLEYYNGILILTSNRVGTFDEAFKSRIQLSLYYPNLTESQRQKIWLNMMKHLEQLNEPNIDYEGINCYLGDLAKFEINGRQIRNAITTARQLAKFQDKTMSFHHLKHVITVAHRFDEYLHKVKAGLSDDQIARESGIR
jgi:SpoVK/Ycf46/Vps4 family AAA+-type ATPase